MKFLDLVESRQSVRRYIDKPVEKEKIDLCIEATRLAPSACNSQPWTYIVVDNLDLKNEVAKATYNQVIAFNKFVPQAPVMVVIVIERPKTVAQIGGNLKNREFPLIDIGISAEHFCLQATELGLGTCMLGWFNEKKIKNLLHIPKNKRIGLVISLGYFEDEYKVRKKIRKETKDMYRCNSYN